MSHARIEEVSDSDPSEGDISDFEDDFDERDILRQRPSHVAPPQASSSFLDPKNLPPASAAAGSRRQELDIQTAHDGTQFQHAVDESKYKNFQCIYPIYFDISRSRKDGRMVGKELAVENPLAREIVTACGRLQLETLFEPTKIHPRDWANPGRVKIRLKGGNRGDIKNKHHLYTLISKHLKANPTTPASAQVVKVPGVQVPDPSKPYPKPAIPKGWKMNDILPYYSPGLSGGGVSENFLSDMMKEMGGAGGAGMPGMPNMDMLKGMMGGDAPAGPSQPAIKEKKAKKGKK